MPSAVHTAGLVSVSSCRKWTEVDHEVGGSPVNWPQTRSNARSFLHHFLTPWGPVYSIEVIIFSMPIYMLLSGAEECEIARNGETMLFALGGLKTNFVALFSCLWAGDKYWGHSPMSYCQLRR